MSYQVYVDAVKTAAIATAKKSLLTALLKKVPFLFWGPIAPLTAFCVEKCVEILIKETEFAAFFLYTDLRVNRQGTDFSKVAIENLKVQQTGTENEKKQSEEKLVACFKTFISFHT